MNKIKQKYGWNEFHSSQYLNLWWIGFSKWIQNTTELWTKLLFQEMWPNIRLKITFTNAPTPFLHTLDLWIKFQPSRDWFVYKQADDQRNIPRCPQYRGTPLIHGDLARGQCFSAHRSMCATSSIHQLCKSELCVRTHSANCRSKNIAFRKRQTPRHWKRGNITRNTNSLFFIFTSLPKPGNIPIG